MLRTRLLLRYFTKSRSQIIRMKTLSKIYNAIIEQKAFRIPTSISGLVVEYNVAIVVTRVRFPADAVFFTRKVVFACKRAKNSPDGTRTHNLLLRRETPYPLGHRTFSLHTRNPFLVSFQHPRNFVSLKLSTKTDTKGIRTPAGRAQWISSPSP